MLVIGTARGALLRQDREYAEAILRDFTVKTGLRVDSKFDTESTKSVSLYEEIVREAGRPRCDVYWNNEILNTIRLSKKGLLEPYASPTAADYPGWTRPRDRSWQAFAAQARVLIVNKNLVAEKDYPQSILDLAQPRWKNKVAMAKPEFGTTATQAVCLFEAIGDDPARRFYQELRRNGVAIVAGNKQSAQGVARGDYAVGLTDTDDAIEELNDGKPVVVIFPDRHRNQEYPRLGTLYIPNTLAIIKGSPNVSGAKKLIDLLLSPEIEKRLAEGGGFQIPLNPRTPAELHSAVARPEQVKLMDVDWERAAEKWEEVQSFLRHEFGRSRAGLVHFRLNTSSICLNWALISASSGRSFAAFI